MYIVSLVHHGMELLKQSGHSQGMAECGSHHTNQWCIRGGGGGGGGGGWSGCSSTSLSPQRHTIN